MQPALNLDRQTFAALLLASLCAGALLPAHAGGFNWSMQHTNNPVGGRSVADETTTKNLLFR